MCVRRCLITRRSGDGVFWTSEAVQLQVSNSSVQTMIENRRWKFLDNLLNDERFTVVLDVMTFNICL